MRLRLLAFCAALLLVFPAYGQEPATLQPDPHADLFPVDPNLPLRFTLAEVVDIMSEYKVVHEGDLMTHNRHYGLTVHESKTIYINSNLDLVDRRRTVIHECLHIIYRRMLGFDVLGPKWEAFLWGLEVGFYSQIYGVNKDK